MFDKTQKFINSPQAKQLVDVRNIGLYIFGIVVLAIAWSGAKTVQNNYNLQKQISALQQQNAVLSLQNQNASLQNQYYNTNQYLELSARQNLGLAAPGEKVLLVPRETAMKYIDTSLNQTSSSESQAVTDTRPTYVKNLEAWRDFLLGRKLFND
ncbi:MAG TPA: septum formation initiator family protein [Candidatus Saccharimonadales bacterium]|nr:septum formation initiator family protein [Candidatus Saccharimonadales bacterium]